MPRYYVPIFALLFALALPAGAVEEKRHDFDLPQDSAPRSTARQDDALSPIATAPMDRSKGRPTPSKKELVCPRGKPIHCPNLEGACRGQLVGDTPEGRRSSCTLPT